MADYNELLSGLIKDELSNKDSTVEDPQRNVLASLIPMAAGVLTGQVSQGGQLGMQTYKGLEDQRQKSRGKLLDYLAKMKGSTPKDNWTLKDTENGIVSYNSRTGEIKPTDLKPFEKETIPSWQQAGGTDNLTLFRRNPKDGSPEIVDTGIKMQQRPLSPFLAIAAKRLEEDMKEREEKKVQKYAEDIEPLAPLGHALETIESYMAKNPSKDLPGVGMLDIAAGKFGMKANLSNPKLTDEEALFVNAVNELKRGESLRTGGKALTQIEMEMVDKGIGLLSKGGEQNFRMGMKYIRDGYSSAMNRAKAKYPEKASKTFSDRGGSMPSATSIPSNSSSQSEIDAMNEELKKRGIQ